MLSIYCFFFFLFPPFLFMHYVPAGQGVDRHVLQEGLPGALQDVLLSGQTLESPHDPPGGLQGALQSRPSGGRTLDLLALMCTRGSIQVVIQGHPPAPVGPLTPEAIPLIRVHHLAPHLPHTPALLPVRQDREDDDLTPQRPEDLGLFQALQGGEE